MEEKIKYRFGWDKLNKLVPQFPGTYADAFAPEGLTVPWQSLLSRQTSVAAWTACGHRWGPCWPAESHTSPPAPAEGDGGASRRRSARSSSPKCPVEWMKGHVRQLLKHELQLQWLSVEEGRVSSQWWRLSPASCPECHEARRTALPPGGRWAWETLPSLWASPPALGTVCQTAEETLMKTKDFLVKLAKIAQGWKYMWVWVDERRFYWVVQPDRCRQSQVFSWSWADLSSCIWSPPCPQPPGRHLWSAKAQHPKDTLRQLWYNFFVQIHSTTFDKPTKTLKCTCSPCLHKAPYTVGWWWGLSLPMILLLIQLVAGCKLALADGNRAGCPRWRRQTSKSGHTCLRISKKKKRKLIY